MGLGQYYCVSGSQGHRRKLESIFLLLLLMCKSCLFWFFWDLIKQGYSPNTEGHPSSSDHESQLFYTEKTIETISVSIVNVTPLKFKKIIHCPRNLISWVGRKWFQGFMWRVQDWGCEATSTGDIIISMMCKWLSMEKGKSLRIWIRTAFLQLGGWKVIGDGSFAWTIFSPIPKQIWKRFKLLIW